MDPLSETELEPGEHYWAMRRPIRPSSQYAIIYLYPGSETAPKTEWQVEQLGTDKLGNIRDFEIYEKVGFPGGNRMPHYIPIIGKVTET
jgi:hypothetical protein